MICYQYSVMAHKNFLDESIQKSFIPGDSVGDGALFIPMKAAPRCFESDEARLPGMKISGSLTELANLRFNARLT